MDGYDMTKKYEAFKIPGLKQNQDRRSDQSSSGVKADHVSSPNDDLYYEIEYDSSPFPGVGKFVLKSQKIEPPGKDPVREIFYQMRDIASGRRYTFDYMSLYNRREHYDNELIFYRQGMFMKDFTDDFPDSAPLSQYFPFYQMMGYEQLRTYFTWRTKVRKGDVANTSLSYAFLYIYELLNNIGVESPEDGLNKLLFFWKSFSNFNNSIDKYVIRWLKDYHIYYELPHSFKKFVNENNLNEHFPQIVDTNDNFDLYCSISKYDIRKSKFYTGNEKLIADCFFFVLDRLKQTFDSTGIDFNKAIFYPGRKLKEWQPFKGALFCPWLRQADRQVILSKNEIYLCRDNTWFSDTVITSEHGRRLTGYIMKQMESELRKAVNYRYSLAADINTVTHEVLDKLKAADISLEAIIRNAVAEYYKEITKIIVKIDFNKLPGIREEALLTQEKLIVPEFEEPAASSVSINDDVSVQEPSMLSDGAQKNKAVDAFTYGSANKATYESTNESTNEPADQLNIEFNGSINESNSKFNNDFNNKSINGFNNEINSASDNISNDISIAMSDPWQSLKDNLTDTEKKAISVILYRNTDIKRFADECGIMVEVLIDGINEKAVDFIGDNLIDDEYEIYDEYKEQAKDLIV